MSGKISRSSSVTNTYTVTASAETSPKIPFGASAGGVFVVTAVDGDATSLAWHVALTSEATPVPINDGTDDLSTSIAVDKAYALPDALFAAPFIVAVTDAGTATIRLCVKG